MKKVINYCLHLFLSYLFFFFASVIYNNKIAILWLVLMSIKKRKDVMLLGDFALEPSENLKSVFL